MKLFQQNFSNQIVIAKFRTKQSQTVKRKFLSIAKQNGFKIFFHTNPEIDWKDVYSMPFQITQSTKLIVFQYICFTTEDLPQTPFFIKSLNSKRNTINARTYSFFWAVNIPTSFGLFENYGWPI